MIIVLDTNVLVSGLIHSGNPPGQIIDRLRSGDISLVLDDRILLEYTDVLGRPYFKRYFSEFEKDIILEFIGNDSHRILCTKRIKGLPDPDDACFAEVAFASNVPLVTGNLKHFPPSQCQGLKILTPAECLDMLDTDSE
jgi:putative PIN family toxin of toxin-antitoxin system